MRDPAQKGTIPTDEALIAYLRQAPLSSLRRICEHFTAPCQDSAGYTPEAKAIRNQLQRLRRAGRLESEGQRWRAK